MAGQPRHRIADAVSHSPAITAGVAVLLRLELHPLAAMEETAVCIAIGFEDPGGRRGTLRCGRDGLRIFGEALAPVGISRWLPAVNQLRCVCISERHQFSPCCCMNPVFLSSSCCNK